MDVQTVSILKDGHKQGVAAMSFDKEGNVRINKLYLEKVEYCSSTKFHLFCLFNFTIFSDPENALNLICMKYYEIDINL